MVQAPHCCRPHPNLVPVKPIASRITQSNGVSGLTSTSYCLPLTFSEIIGAPLAENAITSAMRRHADAFAIHRDFAARAKRADGLAKVLAVGYEKIVVDQPITAWKF